MKAAALALVIAACGRSSAPPPPPSSSGGSGAVGPVAVADQAGATAAVGMVVRVAGTAADDKASAIVDTGSLRVHCLDLASWPAERAGQPVTVEGTLEHTDELEAKTTSTGLVTQGRRGMAFVIRHCAIK